MDEEERESGSAGARFEEDYYTFLNIPRNVSDKVLSFGSFIMLL